jgi:low temperature requirement protein LtrA
LSGAGLRRAPGGHARVTFAELFFDLIFVFAITQISHGLLHHLNLAGLVETLILFLAVWWVWVYTAWATNWLDPDRGPVRAMLFAMMAAGLVMAVALPRAFAETGLVFALAHAAMQVCRTAFTWYALGAADAAQRRNFLRILAWLAAAAPFWVLGGLAEGGWRAALWLIALGIEYVSPALRFRVPGLGASEITDWRIEGNHMAERCGLFLIIALGESILVTGATFANQSWTTGAVLTFASAFVTTLAMWWIYFDRGSETGARHISRSAEPGAMARLGYTYLHALIVGGVVLSAVADELLLAHPDHHAGPMALLLILGGPALFLAGTGFFKKIWLGWFPLSHRVGLGVLALLAPAGLLVSQGVLGGLATLALILVAVWERMSLGRAAEEHA